MNKEAIDFEALKQSYLPNLLSGLAGATLAGGAAGLATGKSPDETDEEYAERRKQNAVMAAIAGGAVGGIAPSLKNILPTVMHGSPTPPPGIASKVLPTAGEMGLGALLTNKLTSKPIANSIKDSKSFVKEVLEAAKNRNEAGDFRAGIREMAQTEAKGLPFWATKAFLNSKLKGSQVLSGVAGRALPGLVTAGGAIATPFLINHLQKSINDVQA